MQFVDIGGKKKAKKCLFYKPLIRKGLRDVKGKKSRHFFIFQLLRYKKKYVRFLLQNRYFFCLFAFF